MTLLAQEAQLHPDRLAFMRVPRTRSICRRMLVISASFCTLIAASPLRPCCCTNTSALGAHRDMSCCQRDNGASSDDEFDNTPLSCPPSKCPCRIQSTSAIKPQIIVSLPANDQIVKWLHLQIGLPTRSFGWIIDGPVNFTDAGPPSQYTARDNCIALCRFLC